MKVLEKKLKIVEMSLVCRGEVVKYKDNFYLVAILEGRQILVGVVDGTVLFAPADTLVQVVECSLSIDDE